MRHMSDYATVSTGKRLGKTDRYDSPLQYRSTDTAFVVRAANLVAMAFHHGES